MCYKQYLLWCLAEGHASKCWRQGFSVHLTARALRPSCSDLLGIISSFGGTFFIFDPKRCIKKGSPEDNRSAKLPYLDSGKKEGLETTMKQHWGGQGFTTTTALMESQYMGTKCLSLISWIRCKSKSIRVRHILQRPRPGEIFFCNVFDHICETKKKRTNWIKVLWEYKGRTGRAISGWWSERRHGQWSCRQFEPNHLGCKLRYADLYWKPPILTQCTQ